MIESMVEVLLKEPDDFLKVKETLTRIGVASKQSKTLFQSCHILHKRGCYYIVHFKELFALDGKPTDFTDNDKGRRNVIAKLLQEWDLVEIVNETLIEDHSVSLSQIKIIPYKEKSDWELVTKYNIGNK